MITIKGTNYYTLSEAGKRMGYAKSTMRFYASVGRIKTIKVAGRRYVSEETINEYLTPKTS